MSGASNRAAEAALDGLLVVSLEQAVAAPYCSRLLSDAGARVIKLERKEGDFARAYDTIIVGQSAYFVWLNVGKESVAVDLNDAGDRALLENLLKQADVFIQNLRFGAIERLGFGWDRLQSLNPRLILCNIGGFSGDSPDAERKAYDALIQAETGLCSVTGPEGAPSKVGISVCDISSGLTAFGEILKALILRNRTGQGQRIDCTLFGTIAEWMTVPWAYFRFAESVPTGRGMDHGQIAPYGDFDAADGKVLIVVQNDREWRALCDKVLSRPDLIADPRFVRNADRAANASDLKAILNQCFSAFSRDALISSLEDASIACGTINSVADLDKHAALRLKEITVSGRLVPMILRVGDTHSRPQTPPDLDQHGLSVREEFR